MGDQLWAKRLQDCVWREVLQIWFHGVQGISLNVEADEGEGEREG